MAGLCSDRASPKGNRGGNLEKQRLESKGAWAAWKGVTKGGAA